MLKWRGYCKDFVINPWLLLLLLLLLVVVVVVALICKRIRLWELQDSRTQDPEQMSLVYSCLISIRAANKCCDR